MTEEDKGKEFTDLRLLIEELQFALKCGFGSKSVNLRPAIEAITDLSLWVATLLKDNIYSIPLDEEGNPSIRELDQVDALGNSKMISVRDLKPPHATPEWMVGLFETIAQVCQEVSLLVNKEATRLRKGVEFQEQILKDEYSQLKKRTPKIFASPERERLLGFQSYDA